jgi:transcriptional regulator with XRE-family HTH domain
VTAGRRVVTPYARLLREVRRERGIPLRELATATGIDRGYLSQIENGLRAATVREQSLIAAALGVPGWRVTLRVYLVVEEEA